MSRHCSFFCIAIVALTLLPAMAFALDLGLGQLQSVTPVDGGCVLGPTGSALGTWAWDIERSHTYTVTISNVTDCANGGMDPTLNVRVNSSLPGYEYTDLVATWVSPGVYQFNFTVPAGAWCTLPILYCTTPGEWLTTGMFVRRSDGYAKQSHLRLAWFDAGCTNPRWIIGPECGTIPVDNTSWGLIKALFE